MGEPYSLYLEIKDELDLEEPGVDWPWQRPFEVEWVRAAWSHFEKVGLIRYETEEDCFESALILMALVTLYDDFQEFAVDRGYRCDLLPLAEYLGLPGLLVGLMTAPLLDLDREWSAAEETILYSSTEYPDPVENLMARCLDALAEDRRKRVVACLRDWCGDEVGLFMSLLRLYGIHQSTTLSPAELRMYGVQEDDVFPGAFDPDEDEEDGCFVDEDADSFSKRWRDAWSTFPSEPYSTGLGDSLCVNQPEDDPEWALAIWVRAGCPPEGIGEA